MIETPKTVDLTLQVLQCSSPSSIMLLPKMAVKLVPKFCQHDSFSGLKSCDFPRHALKLFFRGRAWMSDSVKAAVVIQNMDNNADPREDQSVKHALGHLHDSIVVSIACKQRAM